MTEIATVTPETLKPVESISTVIRTWLAQEIENSYYNSNAYLNGMDTFQTYGSAKNEGHFDRLENWTNQFEKDPTDQEILTRILFGIHMGLSGTFRTQCWIASQGERDYNIRRRSGHVHYGPLGVSINQQVSERLVYQFGRLPTSQDLAVPKVFPEDLIKQTREVNRLRLDTHARIHDDPQPKEHLLRRFMYFMQLARLQQSWLDLGTDYITYNAHLNNGDLSKITFLEPTTISDARPYKPFNLPSGSLQFAPVLSDRSINR